jgi:hypothetical protein
MQDPHPSESHDDPVALFQKRWPFGLRQLLPAPGGKAGTPWTADLVLSAIQGFFLVLFCVDLDHHDPVTCAGTSQVEELLFANLPPHLIHVLKEVYVPEQKCKQVVSTKLSGIVKYLVQQEVLAKFPPSGEGFRQQKNIGQTGMDFDAVVTLKRMVGDLFQTFS